MNMKTLQLHLTPKDSLSSALAPLQAFDADLLLCFGAQEFFRQAELYAALQAAAPRAVITGCSTAGEIMNVQVHDGTLTLTALKFDTVQVRSATTTIDSMADSFDAGTRLGQALPSEGLRHVLVFGTGVNINGSALVDALQSTLGRSVRISGGLAGDGGTFTETFTLGPKGACNDQIVAVGMYGESLSVGNSSFGGWVPFGPVRRITRCRDNILYELDGEPALNVYKRYLGEFARDLPSSGLLFPFELLRDTQESSGIIRTTLGIDEEAGSLALAGSVTEGSYLKLMHGSTDRLIDAAEHAASKLHPISQGQKGLALVVSCVGRKLVMGDRVDEEVEAIGSVLGSQAVVAGFYSYGEISESEPTGDSRLHNQTMTITWINELA